MKDLFTEANGFTHVPIEEQIREFEAAGHTAALQRVVDIQERARTEGRPVTWAELFPDEETTARLREAASAVWGEPRFLPWTTDPVVLSPLIVRGGDGEVRIGGRVLDEEKA